MKKELLVKSGGIGFVAATLALISPGPVVAQSQNAQCLQAATATCGQSTEGYESYEQCVAEERRACLDGLPSPREREPCKTNDYFCGL